MESENNMVCNTGGMTNQAKTNKDARLNIRLDEDIRLDFHITARLRGANAATLTRQLIIEEIKKEKREHSPEKWEEMRTRILEQEQSQQRTDSEPAYPKLTPPLTFTRITEDET